MQLPRSPKNVPMLIGSVSEEGNRMSSNPTEEEWHATLAKDLGEGQGDRADCRDEEGASGEKHPHFVVRRRRTRWPQQRSEHGEDEVRSARAPVYPYFFTWQSPMLDGVAGAWHTAELAFCFDNTKRCEQGTGNTPEAQALARKMATAWANFARTGNPSQPG